MDSQSSEIELPLYARSIAHDIFHVHSLTLNWTCYLTMDDGPGAGDALRGKITNLLLYALAEGAFDRAEPDKRGVWPAGKLNAWTDEARLNGNASALQAAEILAAFDSEAVGLISGFTSAEMTLIAFNRNMLVHGHLWGAWNKTMAAYWVEGGTMKQHKITPAELDQHLAKQAHSHDAAAALVDQLRIRLMATKTRLWAIASKRVMSPRLIAELIRCSHAYIEHGTTNYDWQRFAEIGRFTRQHQPLEMEPYSLLDAIARRQMI